MHEADAIALGKAKFYADVNRTRKADGSQLIYARRRVDRKKAERLHEAIARLHGAETKGKQIDHGNGNTLDNRWGCNLRVVTHQENVHNQPAQRGRAIAYKGVVKRGDYFAAQIRVDGETKCLGTFSTPEEAAIRYNWEIVRLTGAIGRLNEIKETTEVQTEVRSEVAA